MTLTRRRIGIAASAIVALALLLASCGGDQAPSTASQTDATKQTQEEARVEVIRGRATLGDPDAPVVIQEYSDFL